MKRMGVCAALFMFPLAVASSLAQEGKVVVAQSGAKELKRTAHRLRIPVEQLKNVRAALQETTELARRLAPTQGSAFMQIGDSWLQLDRAKAPGVIESLFALLSDNAARATNPQAYMQASSAAQGLLFSLAELDSDKALQLARRWPDPPAQLGEEAGKMQNRLETQFQNQVAQRMLWRNPVAALKMLPPLDAQGQAAYSVRGQAAMQLARMGQREEALKIADQVIADFQKRTPDGQTTQDYAGFLQNLPALDSDRFQDAFGLLSQALAKQPPSDSRSAYQIGNQTVGLTPTESMYLNVLRGIQSRPQLAMSILDSLPDLKEKFDKAGGLDSLLNPNSGVPGTMRMIYGVPGAMVPAGSSAAPRAEKNSLATLYEDLRGKARRDPGMVRSKLNEVAAKQEQLDVILNLVQRAGYEDPDLGSIALDVMSAHLDEIEPLQRRAMFLQNLLGTYRQCEGEVDTELLRNGFILADKMRQEEEQRNPDSARPGQTFGTAADQLEGALISEYARDNYDAAMRFLKSKPDDNAKLMMLLRVVQALRSSY